MFVISRTLGLPQLPPDTWAEPIGIVSLIAEAAFVIVALNVLVHFRPSTLTHHKRLDIRE